MEKWYHAEVVKDFNGYIKGQNILVYRDSNESYRIYDASAKFDDRRLHVPSSAYIKITSATHPPDITRFSE